MRRLRRIPGTFAFVALMLLGACGDSGSSSSSTEAGATTGTTVDFEALEDITSAQFDDPTTIDNKWRPMKPGTRWTYAGDTIEDGESIPHRIVFTVTDLTKVVDGVRAVVVSAQDYEDGSLVETEIAFFAQDNDGTVWHLGEYPEEYEEGKFVKAPGWLGGIGDSKSGIAMKTTAEVGEPSYSQGWAPSVDWTDRAQVFAVGQDVCVPVDCYSDVLIMDEFSQGEPDAFQQKYYAPEVGNIKVGFRGNDPTKESLDLVKFEQLDADGLAKARQQALAIEARAYRRNPDVFGPTEPAS
jgi:hypothetical protein